MLKNRRLWSILLGVVLIAGVLGYTLFPAVEIKVDTGVVSISRGIIPISVGSPIAYAHPAIPTFVATSAKATGTDNASPSLPAGWAENDILLVFVETANEAVTVNQGYAEIPDSPQGTSTGGASYATRLTIFWKRAGASETAPIINGTGNNHIIGCVAAFRGCITTGNPWDVTAGSITDDTVTTMSIPGDTTTVDDCLIILANSDCTDINTAQHTSWTNASLANPSIGEKIDHNTSTGNGGGYGVAVGGLATAGTYSTTTGYIVNSSRQGNISIALKPPVAGPSIPTVTTQSADNIQQYQALLHGTISDTGGENCTKRGFDYGLTTDYGSEWYEEGDFGAEAFEHTITELDSVTLYHFCAKAYNSAGWGYGEDAEFTTIAPTNQTFYPITPVEIVVGVNNAWTDVDVSSYIPSGATGVILHVVNTDAIYDYAIGFQKNGSTDNRTRNLHCYAHCWVAVGVDGNRILEAYIGDEVDVDIYLVGYTMSGVTFFTNAYDKSLGTPSDWYNIDCSAEAPDAIGLIFEVRCQASYDYMGLRKEGSSDNRYTEVADHNTFSAIVGCDSSQICEGYIGSTNVDFFLVGYITDGCVFKTNATNLSLGTTGSWTDLTALPSNAVMGFIEVDGSASGYTYGLRKNSSSEDIYEEAGCHPWAFVECDSSYLIEGKIENTACDFFLVGYAVGEGPSVANTPSSKEFGYVRENSDYWSNNNTSSNLYEYCEDSPGELTPGFDDTHWAAQTFTPTVAHKISAVSLYVEKDEDSGNFTVSIRATDGSGHPTGNDLVSKTVLMSSLTATLDWNKFTFDSQYQLSADTKYAIVGGHSLDGSFSWAVAESGSYTGGNAEDSYDSGQTWNFYGSDFLFREYDAAPAFPLGDDECYFTVTNDGTTRIDISIHGDNFTGGDGWALVSGSPGSGEVRVKVGVSGDANEAEMIVLTTEDQDFVLDLEADATEKWEVKMETGTFTDPDAKEGIITLTAVAG